MFYFELVVAVALVVTGVFFAGFPNVARRLESTLSGQSFEDRGWSNSNTVYRIRGCIFLAMAAFVLYLIWN